MTDLTTAVTMPLVWAHASSAGQISGFKTDDFVLYYLCMLLLTGFVSSHLMWEIAMEVKEGQFSTALVRPMSFYQVCFFRNLSWRLIRPSLFAPFFVLMLIAYRPFLTHATVHLGPAFWASLVLGHLVSFCLVMSMSMFALFVQEATSVFELYYVPMLFLSGQLFPIAVLPTWARELAGLFPFYYTVGAPSEILVGRVPAESAWHVVALQAAWAIGCYLVSKIGWQVGLRHYTAVGM